MSLRPRPTVSWAATAAASIAVITCGYHASLCYHVRGHVPSEPRLAAGPAGGALAVGNFLATFPPSSRTTHPPKGSGRRAPHTATPPRSRDGGAFTLLRAAADATVARRFEYAFIIRYSRAHRVRSSTRPVVA